MNKGKYALFVKTSGLSGFYCGYWSQFYGMEQYPVIVDSIHENSTYKSKKVKTYTSYKRAINGARSCLNSIGWDWQVKIVELTDCIDTDFDLQYLGKHIAPAYDPQGKAIEESLSW